MTILLPLVAAIQFFWGWTLSDTIGNFDRPSPINLATTCWLATSQIHNLPSPEPEKICVSWQSTLDSRHKSLATWPLNSPSNSPESLSISLITPSAQLVSMHCPSRVKLAHVTGSVGTNDFVITIALFTAHFYEFLTFFYNYLHTTHTISENLADSDVVSSYLAVKRCRQNFVIGYSHTWNGVLGFSEGLYCLLCSRTNVPAHRGIVPRSRDNHRWFFVESAQ